MHHAYLTVDLGFGDAGKGSVVDFLTCDTGAHTVIRFNGGAQAAHRVVTASGQEHVFAQFGSGTLAGAGTHLSRFMLLDPLAMCAEEAHLRAIGVSDAFARTTIDERAPIVTPFHRAVNRLRELARGAERHGSCGVGIGETMVDYLQYGGSTLLAGDLLHPDQLRAKLRLLHTLNWAKVQELDMNLCDSEEAAHELAIFQDADAIDWIVEQYRDFAGTTQIVPSAYLHTLLRRPGAVIFEAAQGVLLDEWHGFHPHTTWSTTTLENADTLLAEAHYSGNVTRIGITRAYMTRHGAGPLVTEDAALTAALPDARNGFGTWQRGFRVGWLDLLLLRYACAVVGPLDYLAVTCLDRLVDLGALYVCRSYQHETGLIHEIARSPVPHALDYQSQLTRFLAHCTPILDQVTDTDSLLNMLAAALGLPIGLVSAGPTARDKRWLTNATSSYSATRPAAPAGNPLAPATGVRLPSSCVANAPTVPLPPLSTYK